MNISFLKSKKKLLKFTKKTLKKWFLLLKYQTLLTFLVKIQPKKNYVFPRSMTWNHPYSRDTRGSFCYFKPLKPIDYFFLSINPEEKNRFSKECCWTLNRIRIENRFDTRIEAFISSFFWRLTYFCHKAQSTVYCPDLVTAERYLGLPNNSQTFGAYETASLEGAARCTLQEILHTTRDTAHYKRHCTLEGTVHTTRDTAHYKRHCTLKEALHTTRDR